MSDSNQEGDLNMGLPGLPAYAILAVLLIAACFGLVAL